MNDELKAQLEELKKGLEGKTTLEVKTAIEAFEAKVSETIDAKAKELFDKEIETVKSDFVKQIAVVQDHADKLDLKLQKKGGTNAKSLAEELKEKKNDIKSISNGSKSGEVEIKANVFTTSVSGNQQAVELTDIGQLATRRLTWYDAFPKIPVSSSNNNGVIRYWDWDEATIARAAAMRAEGAAFPESTAAWVTRTAELKKIGDTLPVSEEFYEDEAMFAAELNQFLVTNVDLAIDDQLANGDGTGLNLTGGFASVDAYVPVASGIADASIYDLIPKVCESITVTGGSKYSPNVVMMHKADINKFKLKKDANNNYVMPPFVSRDGNVIDGVQVLESNVVAANTLFLGDSRFARIYEKGGLTLTIGTVNAQFTSDMETLKVRKRLLFLIRGADKGGFKKVTSISAALTTLAS